jgi:choline kinase
MRAVILAAGVGKRLGPFGEERPKCLLEFGGVSLLERHLRILGTLGIDDIGICTGYRADLIRSQLESSPLGRHVSTIENPAFEAGSVVSLWTMRDCLRGSDHVILMDADVLYAPAILERLVTSPNANCLLLDRDFEPGLEPVKICLKDGRVVEFSKQVANDLVYDSCGESVGFFRFAPDVAGRLAQRCEAYVSAGRREAPYEDVIRDLLLETPDQFGVVDITGLPWLEIDFPEDIIRAREAILPAIHGR